jgi:hypothetical protein
LASVGHGAHPSRRTRWESPGAAAGSRRLRTRGVPSSVLEGVGGVQLLLPAVVVVSADLVTASWSSSGAWLSRLRGWPPRQAW